MIQQRFKKLSIQDKIDLLFRQGTFVVSIRYYGYKINLYLLQNYFVEVFYNHKKDKIEKIEVMEKTNKRIKFYSDQIRLPDIFNDPSEDQ